MEEEKRKPDNIEAVTSTVIIAGAVLCGIGGIVLQIEGIAFQTGSLFKYGTYVLRVFSINPDFIGLLLQIAVFLGFATCLTSVLVGIFALRRNKGPLCAGMTLLMLLSASMIAFGAIILFLSGELDKNIQSTGGAQPGALQRNVSDYLLALYTECCDATGLLAPDSDILSQCTPSNQPSQTETCYRDSDLYVYYRRTANAWTCGQLANATVNLDGVLIPNTNIEASALTDGVKIVPIVGSADSPVYGCGAGRALAFQYAFYVWTDQNIRPIALTALICGSLQFLALCFGFATMFITNSDDDLGDLSMFQETNPYLNPAYNFEEQQREQHQRAVYEAQQQKILEQRAAAAEQEAINQSKRASVKIGQAVIPQDVDDRI